MADSFPDSGIDQLTVPERLELIARLWDSIPDSMDALPVPEWHRQELERRLAADDNAEPPIPWEQLRTSLRQNP
jgi:putative addiction module component (TIGR02574 family)